MPAKKLAISLSEEVLTAIDTLAEAQGTSRSAWIEHAARAAIRQQGLRDAVAESGTKTTAKALERLRGELGW